MLYHRHSGRGAPVVLLHGLFGSLENLGMLARALSESFSVYAVDLPNHGRSPHTQSTSLEAMAQQVADWMEANDLPHASFVGHSLGGKVAMELALRDPQYVDRLVAIDVAPAAYSGRHGAVFKALRAVQASEIGSRGAADRLMQEYVDESAVRGFLLKNLIRQDDTYVWRINLEILERDYPHCVCANREGRYEGPVLFLRGGDSDYLAEPYAETIEPRFPQAVLESLEGGSHWLHVDKPDWVAERVGRFLRSEAASE